MHKRLQGESRVSQPAITVVPIAHTTEALRQRGCGGGIDSAGRRVGQSLQGNERAFDGFTPWPDIRTAVAPFAPVGLRARQRLYGIDSRRQTLRRASIGH